jgi:hypothetical protein
VSKKRRKAAGSGGGAAASPQGPTLQRGAQAMFFMSVAFVAAHEGIVGLGEPARTYALWSLAIAGSLVALLRRRDARFTDDLCLALSPRARAGVLFGVIACVALAFVGAGSREHGLFATSTADAALVGCLVFAGAMLAWGGAASAVRTLVGRTLPAVVTGAVVFTMAFFTGNLYADAAVFIAAIAATAISQRTRSIGFAALVFAYGAGGIPAALATSVLYVAVSAARNL